MIRTLRRGLTLFARDMRDSIPLAAQFGLALLAFVFVLLVLTGARVL